MKIVTTLSLVAAALLAGCAVPMPQAAAGVGTQATAFMRNALVEPTEYTSYKAACVAERQVLLHAVNETANTTGQASGTTAFLNKEVRYTRAGKTWMVEATKELRLALPNDAVAAKNRQTAEFIESFAKYASARQDKTVVFVTSPNAADRAWMAAAARKAGVTQVDEQVQAYTSVGWTSPEFKTERPVQF